MCPSSWALNSDNFPFFWTLYCSSRTRVTAVGSSVNICWLKSVTKKWPPVGLLVRRASWSLGRGETCHLTFTNCWRPLLSPEWLLWAEVKAGKQDQVNWVRSWGTFVGRECHHCSRQCDVLAGKAQPAWTWSGRSCKASPGCSAAGGEEASGPVSLWPGLASQRRHQGCQGICIVRRLWHLLLIAFSLTDYLVSMLKFSCFHVPICVAMFLVSNWLLVHANCYRSVYIDFPINGREGISRISSRIKPSLGLFYAPMLVAIRLPVQHSS